MHANSPILNTCLRRILRYRYVATSDGALALSCCLPVLGRTKSNHIDQSQVFPQSELVSLAAVEEWLSAPFLLLTSFTLPVRYRTATYDNAVVNDAHTCCSCLTRSSFCFIPAPVFAGACYVLFDCPCGLEVIHLDP